VSEASNYVQRYFEEHLKQYLHQDLLPEARGITCCFAYHLVNVPETNWVVWMEDGIFSHVVRGNEPAQCTFVCDSQTFQDICSGLLPPQDAFFAKEVEIEGDLELGLMLGVLLAPFFLHHSYRPAVV